MIISHSKQVNFWKIPRTGSSNIEMLLRLLSGLDLSQDVLADTHFFPASANFDAMPDHANGTPGRRRAHITPQTAIDNGFLTLAQYNSYQNFCMVRDPVDRFISSYHLAIPRYDFDPQEIIDTLIVPNADQAVWRPQSAWLTLGNITTLPFSDYVNSLGTILAAFGATVPDQLPNVSRAHIRYETFIKQIATGPQRQAIETYYAADMGLST
jgi:hypothetical protein